MNLMQYHEKLSRDGTPPEKGNKFFSEQITMFNVLSGRFLDDDIVNVTMHQEDMPTFSVAMSDVEIAEGAEQNLDKMIVPGAYEPFYELNVSRDANVVHFKLKKI